MLAFILLHLYVTRREYPQELRLVLSATLVGLIVDNTLGYSGLVSYVGTPTIGYVPFWLIAIWSGFGATVRHSQALFFRSRWHAFLTGFLGGPLAYAGGVKLGCLEVQGAWGYILVGACWTFAMLGLFFQGGVRAPPRSA